MVVIKDMEMPKCCNECPLFHFYLDTNGTIHFICKFRNMEMCGDLKNKRNDFCPLIVMESEEYQTGHWIRGLWGYSCSRCKNVVGDVELLKYGYCPNCGANMEVKANGDSN